MSRSNSPTHLGALASSLLVVSSLALGCDPPQPRETQVLEPIDQRSSDICEAPCEAGATCCTERFVHGSGASIGWTQRGAAMFTSDDPEATADVLNRFKQWISERPERAGLSVAMPNTAPLAGLTAGNVPPRHHGSLVLHRFAQSYRGLPVVGAGEHVTVTLAPGHGAVSVSGAIVDARDTYSGWELPSTPEAAVSAAAELLTLEVGEFQGPPFTFGEPRLVAIAEIRAVAWEIDAFQGGHLHGTLLLRADTGAMLTFSPSGHYSLDDAVAVKVRARTFASDFFSPDPQKQIVADIDEAPFTGGPLLGSSFTPLVCQDDPDALPGCGQTRLGNDNIIVLDADDQDFYGDNTSHPHISTSQAGAFLVTPPVTPDEDVPLREEAAVQDYFYRLQGTYSLVDNFHAGKWDPFRGDASGFPAPEYKPRVLLATNTNIPLTCGASQPGCTTTYFPFTIDNVTNLQIYDEHPEADLPPHVWMNGINPEAMAFIGTAVDGFKSPDLLFHEFGHVVDLFTVPGFVGDQIVGSGCSNNMQPGDLCVEACAPNSTDESGPLSETIADMVDIFSIGQLYTTVEYGRCEAISSITGVSGPVHDPGCVDAPNDIKSFLDQRPSEAGFVEHDGLWFPTGKCSRSPGYRQSGILQAWWEWTHARSCSPTEPFACESFAGEESGAKSGIEALLFALSQTNATYYKKLFTDMETYLACTDGPEQASRFRAVFCHHGALDCQDLPAVCPAVCGDGEAEATEACDGDDLRGQGCFDHGFAGGQLACNAACEYDISLCTDDAATTGDPTTPTSGEDIPTTDGGNNAPSTSDATDSEGSGAEQAEDGCSCRGGGGSLPGLLPLALLLWRRRRIDRPSRSGVS